jgi:hypothetical protein
VKYSRHCAVYWVDRDDHTRFHAVNGKDTMW